MKVVFAPISDMAPHDALTPREWEALGRLAVRIEAINDSVELLRSYAWGISLDGALVRRVQWMLAEEGLNNLEWVVIVQPHYAKRMPADAPFERWVVDLRLRDVMSAAKSNALTSEAHAPTLAEQHGKK
jgi:hypothetical protein